MKKIFTIVLALAATAAAGFRASAGPALSIGTPVTVTPASGALYANDENHVTNLSYTVSLTNNGDTDLNPGDEGFSVSLVYYSSGAVLQTLPVSKPIAVGQTVEETFNWDFSVDPMIAHKPDAASFWTRLDLKENVSNTTMNVQPWRDVYKSSVAYNLVGETSGTEISETLDFGFVTAPSEMKLRIRATGTKDVKVTSVELPAGFTLEPATPFTVTGLWAATTSDDCYTPVTLKFNPQAAGVTAGNLKLNVEGAEPKEYPVSGALVGENSFFESFDGEGGSDYQPAGWVLSSHWSLKWKSTSDTDKYVLAHSSADDVNFDFAITPKLRFGEGEAMTFEAAKRSYSSRLEVYYSPDRTNWTLLKTITPYGDGGSESFPSSSETLGTYVLSGLPAGDWYIGFKGMYVYLNNVFGGERVAVAHDAMITASDFPTKATVNNLYSMTLKVKNLSDYTEAAGSYSVKLMAGDKVLAEAETPEWASLEEKAFAMSYTPHEAGDTELRAVVSLTGVELSTVPATVTVAPESASYSVVVGAMTGSSSNNLPLRTNWYNSESQCIYTAEYLAKYGVTPGAKITGLAYDAKASADKKIATTLKIWLKKVEESTISKSAPYATDDADATYSSSYTLDVRNSGGEYYEIINAAFSTPFVYEGGNLLVIVRSEEADGYKLLDFQEDPELKSNAIYKYNDNHNTFMTTASWYEDTGLPVTKFHIHADPATFSGTVTDAHGNPVSGTAVDLRAGDVIYGAVTDDAGAYSIEVFQADLDYTVTVDNPAYPVYTAAVSFAGGQPDGNIVLADFSANRDYELTVKVTSSTSESLEGRPFTLTSGRFSIEYPESETKLGADGTATLMVYGGTHTIALAVPGMKPVTESFAVNKPTTVELSITEDVQTPFGVKADVGHDIFTGKNVATLRWNGDEAVFAEGFEDMAPFTIDLTPWTGIDGDNAAPVVMQGTYPNAGSLCYAQVINPMAVTPIWDPAVYPTLMAKEGRQYAGFPDLANGKEHNDWLITPAIEVGEANVLRFSIKSADKGKARFTVGITSAANPAASDFTIISEGNYIEAAYDAWTTVEIPLNDYAGQTVKIGFHCISASGAFISQLDDVFVGRPGVKRQGMARRAPQRSAANPNEKFVVRLDGEVVGETDGYELSLGEVQPGEHTASVTAVYLNAQSEPVEVRFAINADDYAEATFAVTTNNGVMPEPMTINLAETDGDKAYTIPVTAGAATVASLPKGVYDLTLTQQYYEPYSATLEVAADCHKDILLKESIIAPFNVVHEEVSSVDGLTDVKVSWNRNLGFADGFETYDDFATGTFGDWTTVDNNTQPSYPISFLNRIVNFPGCSTTSAPAAVPPMVFNPLATNPSMADDAGVQAPEGVKTVLFQGPQGAKADKWLIAPKLMIRDDYELSFLAKAYDIYSEKLEICVSTTGTDAADFTVLDAVQPAEAQWTRYALSLAAYAGQEAYLAVHCISSDGFIVQVDDFNVGRKGGETAADAGYVQSFDVTHNGGDAVNTTEPEIMLTGLSDGTHTVGIKANYASGASEVTTYEFTLAGHSGMTDPAATGISIRGGEGEIVVSAAADVDVTVVNTLGMVVARTVVSGTRSISVAGGVYVVAAGSSRVKVAVR